jgi:hypothetical protein
LDVLRVDVAVIALQRSVAFRMTVHAARVHKDRIGRQESRARGSLIALGGSILRLRSRALVAPGLASLSDDQDRADHQHAFEHNN